MKLVVYFADAAGVTAKVSVALSNPYDLWWFINATTPGLYTV